MSISDPGTSGDPAWGASGSVLTIDLNAVVANYRTLSARLAGARCAAVVKADAYGLGLAQVAPALAEAGCETFFVAHLNEGVALRRLLPDAVIYVLNGALAGAEPRFAAERLMPVLNDLDSLARWAALGRSGRALPAALHVDTGMSRLGLAPEEVDVLSREPGRLEGVDLRLVMSHLACAEEPDHPLNEAQLTEFRAALKKLPPAPASLANSSGVFLDRRYHLDLARPGAALYGVNPRPGAPNPMAQAVALEGRILQVRDVDSPRTVGYGATHRIDRPSRLATVAVGYADGYLRSLSARGFCYIGQTRVPVVGRVSMDLITLDVTALPAGEARPGRAVEIIGPRHPVDTVAEEAGTIGYEILTSLGRRYHRRYVGGSA